MNSLINIALQLLELADNAAAKPLKKEVPARVYQDPFRVNVPEVFISVAEVKRIRYYL